MKLLRDLVTLSEAKEDMTKLPPDVISEIQKNIRDGADDQQQKWSNALELVHKAYEVAAVQRPTPEMRDAWQQYEENIQYAVEQRAKYRGLEGDWRMSSHVFHEAMEKKVKFRVTTLGDKFGEGRTVKAKSLDDVIDAVKARNTSLYDVDIQRDEHDPTKASMTFSKWGIKKNYRINIERIF